MCSADKEVPRVLLIISGLSTHNAGHGTWLQNNTSETGVDGAIGRLKSIIALLI